MVVFSEPSEEAHLESLTSAERAVAKLAVRGLTNAQIASRRRVSRATIAKQLESIYRKLAIRSRADLARVFASTRETQ